MASAARRRVVDNYSTVRVAERYEALFGRAIQMCEVYVATPGD